MMFWNGSGWAWWQAGLMRVAMIAFWAALAWVIYDRRAAGSGSGR